MNHKKAAGILSAIVLVAIGYIVLSSMLGIGEFWVGFLFLVSWAIIEQMEVSRLPAAIAGSLTGALLAYAPLLLSPFVGGSAASGITLAFIILAIYAILVGWLPLVINNSFMLFLNVLSIPHLVRLVTPFDVAKGLIAGILFFGGLALLSVWFVKTRQRKGAAQA